MKTYLDEHLLKYPKTKDNIDMNKNKSYSPVKKPYSPSKKKARNNTESEIGLGFNGSKLLAPKFS